MKLVTLYLPESYIRLLDELVDERFFPNRAEALRMATRDLLVSFDKFNVKTYRQSKERRGGFLDVKKQV